MFTFFMYVLKKKVKTSQSPEKLMFKLSFLAISKFFIRHLDPFNTKHLHICIQNNAK